MCHLEHINIVNVITDELKKQFPSAGLAICGSVAKNKHNKESDIDLLLVADFVLKSFQFVSEIDGIKVNILNITPNYIQEMDYHNIQKWLYSYNVVFLGYLFSAKILHDPNNYIQKIINDCESLLVIKKTHKEKLLLELEKKCNSLLFKLEKERNEIIKYRVYINIIDIILCYWFLKNELYLRVKSEYNHVFAIIKQKDTEFYDLLTNIFPIASTRITVLTKTFKYLGITYENF